MCSRHDNRTFVFIYFFYDFGFGWVRVKQTSYCIASKENNNEIKLLSDELIFDGDQSRENDSSEFDEVFFFVEIKEIMQVLVNLY